MRNILSILEEARRSVSHSSTTYTTSTGYSGGMSLHELNNRLERYINQIQINPGDPQVSINVDRIRSGFIIKNIFFFY